MQKYEAVCKLFSIGQGHGHEQGQGNELCKTFIIPQHADVANAYGAALAEVSASL